MYKKITDFIRQLYKIPEGVVPLHAPVFLGNEKKYVIQCIDDTFVSYVGKFVDEFEKRTAEYTGAKFAIATVNGTTALQVSLLLAGVEAGDEVITQPLTFVATANAIRHANACPVFVDVDLDTLGMSPEKLDGFLKENTENRKGECYNNRSGRRIKAVLPMHTFGHPCRIDEITAIANFYNLPVIEDAAESLGSFYKGKHTGTFGLAGTLSYNGNKIVTTGGGGMILTNNEDFHKRAKHITTTGKVTHPWEYVHDIVAYNYRLTNINAAIGVSQMEYLNEILQNKRETAKFYQDFFKGSEISFCLEPPDGFSNYWLNAIRFRDRRERDQFLNFSYSNKVTSRPIWRLMNKLNMYKTYQTGDLHNAEWLESRIVCIPSGYRR